jgi:hypothetical protein
MDDENGIISTDDQQVLSEIEDIQSKDDLKKIEEKYFSNNDSSTAQKGTPTETTDESGNKDNSQKVEEGKAKAEESGNKDNSDAMATDDNDANKLSGEEKKSSDVNGSSEIEDKTSADGGQSEKSSDKGKVLITDDIIDSFPEADRAALRIFKGRPVEEILKSYVNAQKLVGKRRNDMLNIANPLVAGQVQATSPIPNTIPQQQSQSQAQAAGQQQDTQAIKSNMALNTLKQQFPNLAIPTNDEKAFSDYVADLMYSSPIEANRLVNAYANVQQSIEQDFNKIAYTIEHHHEFNQNELGNQVAQINSYVGQFGVDLKKDLGIDLSVDANGDNKVLNQILCDETGQLDRSLVQYVGNAPLLKPQAIATKFLTVYMPQIVNKITQKSRGEGYTAATQKKDATPTTMASMPTVGKQSKTEYSPEEIENINDPEKLKDLLVKVGERLK